jgi:hypothetical protein
VDQAESAGQARLPCDAPEQVRRCVTWAVVVDSDCAAAWYHCEDLKSRRCLSRRQVRRQLLGLRLGLCPRHGCAQGWCGKKQQVHVVRLASGLLHTLLG